MNIKTLKSQAQDLKSQLGGLYLAFKHKRTPWYVKVIIVLVISYALSPIDLVPDFIPVLGYIDDLLLIPAGIALAIKLIPDDIIMECRKSQGDLSESKIKGIYAGIFIIIIWLFLIYVLLKNLRIPFLELFQQPFKTLL